jgi:hypothetical protein
MPFMADILPVGENWTPGEGTIVRHVAKHIRFGHTFARA